MFFKKSIEFELKHVECYDMLCKMKIKSYDMRLYAIVWASEAIMLDSNVMAWDFNA